MVTESMALHVLSPGEEAHLRALAWVRERGGSVPENEVYILAVCEQYAQYDTGACAECRRNGVTPRYYALRRKADRNCRILYKILRG